MRYVRITLRVVVLALLGLFFNYTLPQQDVAYITAATPTGTEVTFGTVNRFFYSSSDGANQVGEKRQIAQIYTSRQRTWLFGLIRGGQQDYVYRNEDTGFWPPYFKFDTSNLQATAVANISTAAEPKWVVIRHYGWRVLFFTIYPNAIDIRPIDGPDYRPIPWFNICFFAALIGIWFFLRAVWMQFRERTIDPAMERAGDRIDHLEAGVNERRSRFRRWLGTWTGKK